MTVGEDGRPYIAVRRKMEEEKEKVQGRATQENLDQNAEADWMEEEEQYLTTGADRRPYIAVRRKLGNKPGENRKKEEIVQGGVKIADSLGVEDADVKIGEGVTQVEEEDGEIDSFIRDYQQNAVPETWDLRLMELYGGTEWRTSERDDVKRCIPRILERRLENNVRKSVRNSDKANL